MTNNEKNEVEPKVPGDEKAPGEEAPAKKKKEKPYMGDVLPAGKEDQVKWYLLHGKSEEELVAEGHNKGTVRIAAQHLEKEGLRKRPKKPPPEDIGSEVARLGDKGTQVYARGSPPEAIIEGMRIPVIGADGFEKGMKFGASLVVLGVRVAQELSAIGIQQARPVMEMAKSMREGEAMAAKGAAVEAAGMAAAEVGAQMAPYLANIGKGSEADPVKAMMVRTMEPLMNFMMKKFMPGTESPTPTGWSRKTVKKEE